MTYASQRDIEYYNKALAGTLPPTAASPTGGYAFLNVSTVTTTTVKTGAATLSAISINTKGTVASTITVYDSLSGSGTKIATLDSLNLSGSFIFNVACTLGITVVSTGTVAPDFTVVYK
jgi:hypothetical protein